MKTRFDRWLRLCILLGTLSLPARAELEFPAVHLERDAKPGEKEAVFAFPFENTGGEAVRIASVASSCDCTVAEIADTTIDPGQKGEIKAVFKFGARLGEQEKKVLVTTKDPETKRELSFRVRIPELATVSPGVLFWKKGSEETKTARIEFPLDDLPASEVKLHTVFDEVEVDLKTIEPGRAYEMEVTPKKEFAGSLREQIVVEARFAGVGSRIFKCHAFAK